MKLKLKVILFSLVPVDDGEALKFWAKHPWLSSAVNKLQNRIKEMRRVMEQLEKERNQVIKSCKYNPPTRAANTATVEDDDEIPDCIRNPAAMPVDITDGTQLNPFFHWLNKLREAPLQDVQFQRGTYLAGGHVDMCKQVVGPAHAASLFDAVKGAAIFGAVEHLLLGNNVAFESDYDRLSGPGASQCKATSRQESIDALLDMIGNKYGLKTLYLAGNCIDGPLMQQIAEVLVENTVCKSLWLKRNPLGLDPKGPEALALLLAKNRHIEALDLHNVGLLDAGIEAMAKGLLRGASSSSSSSSSNSATTKLAHLHIGANGITEKGAKALASILEYHLDSLESVYVDINRLGDAGMAVITKVLARSKVLKRFVAGSNRLTDLGLNHIIDMAVKLHGSLELLDVGYYKSTLDMQERLNNFTSEEPFIRLLSSSSKLRLLKLEKCGLSIEQVQRILQTAADQKSQQHLVSVFASQQSKTEKELGLTLELRAHDEATLSQIKNPPIVEHIYSIYRNNL